MENDEIVMNQERRLKFKKWFSGALMPCRSKDGVIRYVGTILHMDSMLESLMPSESDKASVNEDLKLYTTKRSLWKGVKYRAHNSDFTKILWSERMGKEELQFQRKYYQDLGIPEVYSQEYLNIPIDESTSFFKKADFLPMTTEDKKLRLNYYITVDLAISEKQRADFSVFLVAGVDESKRIHVVDVIRERIDGRQIVDQLIALQRSRKPMAIGIEESQISKSLGPFLREAMYASNEYIDLIPLSHMSQDKIMRARSVQARCRAKGVKFDKDADWYQIFEDECTRFPRDKHDDQVDAFAYLGLMLDKLLEAPTIREEQDEIYEDEYRQSGLYEQGRSVLTGY